MFHNKTSELAALVSPPEHPMDFDDASLQRNQGILRIEFPQDVVEYARTFGSGTFDAAYSWEVWSPARRTYPLIVLEFSRICNIFKEAMEIDDVPFPIFPEVGGILPFASSDGGDWVCWITDGEPDDWKVVDLYQYEQGFYQVLEMGFSEYFIKVLTREIVLDRHKEGETWNSNEIEFRQKVQVDRAYVGELS